MRKYIKITIAFILVGIVMLLFGVNELGDDVPHQCLGTISILDECRQIINTLTK